MQGDLAVIASRAGLAGGLLVLPMLLVAVRGQDFASFGPLADSWWVIIVLGTVGLAFALDAIARVSRALRRSAQALDQGYGYPTVLRVLCDRGRDMGFLVSGLRHFSVIDDTEREAIASIRVVSWLLLAGAGLWLIVTMALGLFLAARGALSASGLQLFILLPAVVLYLFGAVASVVQDARVRRARSLWHQQPWSADLAAEEIKTWQTVSGTGRASERGERLVLVSTLVAASAIVVVLPVLTLMPASAVGPIIAAISVPNLDRYRPRAARAEAFRSYRVEGDVSISPTEAGAILHTLVFVGVADEPSAGEREPTIRVSQLWFSDTDDGENPTGLEPHLWGDSLFARADAGMDAAQRRYLASLVEHPLHTDFSRLARATALDAGSARWEVPFPPGVTMATIPVPRFASVRDAAHAHIGSAALAFLNGRNEDAERLLGEVISVGFLLADDGPTLIDNLIGFVLVEEGGAALADFYRVSGNTAAASELSKIREVAETSARMMRSETPISNDAWVRSLYRMTTDSTIARGLRWEYFINLTTIAPCLNMNRIVFGVGDEYDAFIEEARASLVRWPSDEALFDVARYGWIGASQPGAPTVLSRVAGLYMDSGENSCGRYVRHMQAADVF
jgi:hypothetical protein